MKRPATMLAMLLIATGLLAAAAPARAQHFYIGLDLGPSWSSDACNSWYARGQGAAGCSNKGVAVRVVTGYEFNRIWSGEISYANYGTANIGTCLVTGPCGIAGKSQLGYWTVAGFQVAGIATLPLGSSGVSAFGKLGFAQTTLDIAVAATDSYTLTAGFGAQYDFDRRYRARIQYEDLGTIGNGTTGRTKITLLTAGFVVRF